MWTLRIQWSLYPYLVSICFMELDVLKIPKSQIYHIINGDFFAYFKNLFVFNLLEVDFYKCNKGHQGILSYFHPFQCYFIAFIYMIQDKNGDVTHFFVYFTMLMPRYLKVN
jgi:hypothetical protein